MSNHSLRALAGAAIGVLLTCGLWFAIAASAPSRTEAALRQISAETSLKLQRQALKIMDAGETVLAQIRNDDRFRAAATAFEETIDASEGAFRFVGLVELRRQAESWAPRRSHIGAASQQAGADMRSLRVDAMRIVGAADAGGRPRYVSAQTDAPLFWLVWSDPEARLAIGALIRLDDRPSALGLGEMQDPQIGRLRTGPIPEDAFPDLQTTARYADRLRVLIGGEEASAPLSVAAPGLLSVDQSLALPLLGLAALVFGAMFLLLRTQRRREEQISARQRAIVDSIAATQTELEDTEARFRHLAESTNVIPWRVDLDANRFTYIGPQIEELTGYPASTWRAEGFWMQHIYARDRARVRKEAAEKAEQEEHFTLKYRIRNQAGEILHIRNMLSVSRMPTADGRHRMTAQGFMLDVTEQVTAEEKLELAYATAERANNVKSQFLATMSHELRTPLNAIIGFSEIMKDELFGPLDPQYQDYSASVHSSGKHLLSLINDILDLSKIEAGRFELHEEPTDIAQLIEECRQLMQERMSNAGLRFEIETDPDLPEVLMDERRMKQVLLNLLSNAQKFTDEGGAITLSARRQPDDGVALSVRDTGVGMTAEEIPQALEAFGQIDGKLARRHDGTGLGLPIANSLTKLHGGDLKVESQKGVGTAITIALPENRLLPRDGNERVAR